MARKVIWGVLGAGLVAVAVFGTEAYSYLWTSARRVQETVKDNVPLDFEIDRARGMVQDLVPEIRQNMHLIAKEEVEVARLARQIEQVEAELAQDRAQIERLKTDLGTGTQTYVYAGHSYSIEQVRTDLARRFDRYKTVDATLASLREMHAARVQSLDAARQKLEGMLAAKRQLEVDVEHLEARLKMVEAAQTTSQYTFDDSQLSRAKELVGDLRARLDVAERLVSADSQLPGEIPLEETPPADLLEQISEYFATPAPAPAPTAVAEAPIDLSDTQ